MSLQIQKIYQDTAKTYQIHKLTGDSGLTRECSWVQLCEDIDTFKFLRGGELVITTGLMCERREGGCRRSSSRSCATARAASSSTSASI